MSALTDEFKHVVTTLEAEGHHLADRARAALGHYEHLAAALVGEIRPVLDETKTAILADVTDAVTRVEAAVAKVEALVHPAPAPAPAPADPPAAEPPVAG
jgi:hypothetical protein